MNDVLTEEQRRYCMSRIKGRDTKPEIIVRKLVHSLGFRYRLHDRSLPGSPDLVFASKKKVIFVHGCFWHRHSCKNGRVIPKTRTDFWTNKFSENVRRDRLSRRKLARLGFRSKVIWECQTGNVVKLTNTVWAFLAED